MVFIKRLLESILLSDLVYKLVVRFVGNNISYKGIYLDTSNNIVPNRSKSLLFWKLYERAEMNMIENYVRSGDQVIELGASLGVVSSYISRIIGDSGSLKLVEANPSLIEVIKQNLVLNNSKNFEVINGAINYSEADLVEFFVDTDHLSSSIIENTSNTNAVLVKSYTLSDVVGDNIEGGLILISDIEGAEAGFLLYEDVLSKIFKMVIIELHDVIVDNKRYSVDALASLFVNKHGFVLVNRKGNVFVFSK